MPPSRTHLGDARFGAGIHLKTNIAIAQKLLDELVAKEIRALGLSLGEADLLTVLLIELPKRPTPTALASWLRLTTAGMAGRLNSLERAGLIQRETHATDRRRISVHLSESGQALAEKVLQAKDRTWTQLLDRELDGDQTQLLIESLEELNRVLTSAGEETP